jgi:hypothetical protein
MSGRNSGHFGTGVYFVSSPDKVGRARSDRPTQKISFDGFNLATPRNNDGAQLLHDGLRQVNRLVTADLETKEADEVIEEYYDDLLPGFGTALEHPEKYRNIPTDKIKPNKAPKFIRVK